MRIINKPFMEFTDKQRSLLYRDFTLPEASLMKESIDVDHESIDAFVVVNGDDVLGWSLVVNWERKWKLFMVFIHPDHRGNGIATRLAEEAKKKYKNIGMIQDIDNKFFVDRINKKIGIYVEKL